MANIIDELVRVGVFHSKGEARSMIKNGGVSVIPAFYKSAVPPCFDDNYAEAEMGFLTVTDRDYVLERKLGLWDREGQAKIYKTSNIRFYDGMSMMPDGTLFPARIWDNRGWDPVLAQFRENLVYGTGHGIRFDCGWIMTWDTNKYGKNPWLVSEKKLECNELKDGDVVKIGKKRTVVIGE